MGKKTVQNNGGSTGGVTGKGFAPGVSGNPGGRPRLPDDLKAVLKADSLMLYEKAKELLETSLEAGELEIASRLVLGLLKKTIPDTNTLLVSDPDGGPLKVLHIDPTKLSTEQLRVLLAIQKAQAGG